MLTNLVENIKNECFISGEKLFDNPSYTLKYMYLHIVFEQIESMF